MTANDKNECLKECEYLQMLNHPNILKLYEFYQTRSQIIIISELCSGGQLMDEIERRKGFTEVKAKVIVTKILEAM